MSMKNKGVSFNLDDPGQKSLYDFAVGQSNFSSYVKRLIQSDRDRNEKRTTKNGNGGIQIRMGE